MFSKLNQNIPLFAGALLIFFIFIFSTVSYYKMKSYVKQTALEKQMLMMKNLQGDINYWMRPKIAIMSELAKEIEINIKRDINYWNLPKNKIIFLSNKDLKSNFLSPKEKIEHLLKRTKTGINSIQVYLGLKNGLMLFDRPRLQSKGYDPRVRQWYKNAIIADKTLVSDPFIGKSSNQLTIGIMSPIVVNGEIQGVVSASFFVNHIYKKVKMMKIDDGYAFIVGTNGNIIIHPEKENINQNLNSLLIKNNDLYNYMKINKEGIYEYNYKGDEKIMTFGELDNGWFAVVTTKKDAIFSVINDLLKLFVTMGTLMIILTIIILFSLAKTKTRPI